MKQALVARIRRFLGFAAEEPHVDWGPLVVLLRSLPKSYYVAALVAVIFLFPPVLNILVSTDYFGYNYKWFQGRIGALVPKEVIASLRALPLAGQVVGRLASPPYPQWTEFLLRSTYDFLLSLVTLVIFLNVFSLSYRMLIRWPKAKLVALGRWLGWIKHPQVMWKRLRPSYCGILHPTPNSVDPREREKYPAYLFKPVGASPGQGEGDQPRTNGGALARFFECYGHEFRIGIVLAGGGAKGAYQAGAMRAIYEFLAKQEYTSSNTNKRLTGLECVRCIAGSSIGAWNAMFWLTKQIADGTHYGWWRDIKVHQLVEPANWYWPLRMNYVLSNEPWRRNFEVLFPAKRIYIRTKNGPHFYFTRTNVGTGQLEFSTDLSVPGPGASYAINPDLYRARVPNKMRDENGQWVPLEWVPKADGTVGTTATSIDDVKQAVFASMDLPPLFKRVRGRNRQWYEDGGVVCNIPVQFATAYEGCQLVFILPLNASFEQPVDHGSVMKRFMRIVDVRQGVIERAALTDLRLYNGYNLLLKQAKNAGIAGTDTPALSAHFHTVTPFIICPKQPLVIGTTEFWKSTEADEAYCMMYEATKQELTQFNFDPEYVDVWMTLVDQNGNVSYQAFR